MKRSMALLCLSIGCASPEGPEVPNGGRFGERILDPGCVGSAWATIQEAIDAAADGDVIELCGGTYQERLTIAGKRLRLRARVGEEVTVDGQEWGTTLAISAGADVTVDHLILVNGLTPGRGGNVSCDRSSVKILDSRIASGSAGNGGGLGASGCTGRVVRTTFEGNSAWRGGAANVDRASDIRFERNRLLSNQADSAGGGLYLEGDSPILDNRFEGNRSNEHGGGLYVEGGWGEVRGNLFQDNRCRQDGGGFYVHLGGVQVTENRFVGNHASDEGGGLRIKESEAAIVEGNRLIDNRAERSGGGLRFSHGPAATIGNTLIRNSAGWYGGGASLYECDAPSISNTFLRNEAWLGGGMHVEGGWDPIDIEDSVFVGNEATGDGGNLYVSKELGVVRIHRSTLRRGVADHGGGIYLTDSEVELANSVISGNRANDEGGGVYYDRATGAITNLVILRNQAPDGAGLVVEAGGGVEVLDTVFAWNGPGAALEAQRGASPDVRYNDFFRNAADFSGMASAVGVDGNLAVNPRFVDVSAGDFALRRNSPLIDAGDPGIADLDGSRADIGLYGGPESPGR